MNTDIVRGKWDEFKGEARKIWGDISDNDLDRTNGNVEAIGGLIRQKYGQFKDDAKDKWEQLLSRYGHEAANSTGQVKDALQQDRDRTETKRV
jgi:uncharacterized protein YjbJ (UPF0337 family)